MSAPSLNVDSQVEKMMMQLGGGVLTDLDRFVLGDNKDYTLDGEYIHNATDYFGGWIYDHEPQI